MKKSIVAIAVLVVLLASNLASAAQPGEPWTPRMKEADAALKTAMADLGVDPGQPGFMVLTNAGYGQADRASTEPFLDVAAETTGRTPGTRTLLLVNTPCFEPLWFALVRQDDQRAVFLKLGRDGFASQALNLSPDSLFVPEAWASAAKGLIGSRLFSVASISLSWAAGAPWPMLKGAELHDHFCPGLNAGFLAKAYLDQHLPLGPGDGYVFVGAPPICAMDALQSAYGATMGKHGAYAMLVPDKAEKMAKDGVAPTLIAMRVNKKKDVCDGVFLGFDWDKSESFTGVSNADRTPPGGKKNPLFFISRVKMSWKLAQMPLRDKLACIKDLRRFSGPAALADNVASAGADPYAAALAH
ncbi:FmdE family protein [Pseudodesulfovibrio sp.]|uniref:FmdE family protein n=1 Tax=Pseudodesulfovibrio sp. TaxID=2035812 RepID=UPI0026169DE4|nr:FmdE family protein [Pseudodesulfovibrio sp.]MDD3311519.1 FmdE family protein [Pseudodesulfovibrio sp.]